MIVAEIITIGTELLLGEIQDTNTQFLARQLRELGINLFRTTMIGDNKDRIADLIKETTTRSDLIITTGGLGPTVDDPTREAVAQSLNTSLEYDPSSWYQITARFSLLNRIPTENNKRQAYFPKGAIVIKNPVGTAPAFIVDSGKSVLVSLPGVPRELDYLFQNDVIPFLRQRFDLKSTIKVHVLHVSGMGESAVDEIIGDLEELVNPTVGLLAHSGQIDIRIAANAASEKDAEILISSIIKEIKTRLGDAIFGVDDENLPFVISKLLQEKKSALRIAEYGVGVNFLNSISEYKIPFITIKKLDHQFDMDELKTSLSSNLPDPYIVDLWLSVNDADQKKSLEVVTRVGSTITTTQRYFAGPLGSLDSWVSNSLLDNLRRELS